MERPSEETRLEEELMDDERYFHQDIRDCFAVFDPKNTGLLQTRFFDKALRAVGVRLSSFEIEHLTEKYDKGGSIEFADFEEIAMYKLMEMDPANQMKEAFAMLDTEKEGVILTDRFRKWMVTLGDPLTDAEAKEIARMGDPAGKGVINYSDIVAMLAY